MEPTAEQQPVQNLQPLRGEIVSLCMYMPIEDLVEDYSYEVVIVDVWFGDIYVVIDNFIIDTFNIICLPPSYHESFTQFLAVIKSNNVQSLYIKYMGSAEEGHHLLRAHGGGVSRYMY